MHKLLILDFVLIFLLFGCFQHNNCYEQCYAAMNTMPGPFDGEVEYVGCNDELEKVRTEDFSDCIIVGKSHFSGPPVSLEILKRFAAKKGANIILWRWKPERAGLKNECQCNPMGSHHVEVDEIPGGNEVKVVSKSVSVSGSAASGPDATLIYAHQVWFLYKDN